ncbi:MAG: beta-hydroxyacyl-ACP dehydratase [Planctomycetaceae bacterium]|jgi:3-hydroxyacyl-[acyl-carrier-protein] dehydratase|nr:beta-hydroxyacyl-ACP dehydratase [Planctomycetaceae bacterium]
MYFSLIDRIEALESGKSIVATKSLSMSEEYLRDHFPRFPVMPGVLMLEALTQTSAWLIRVSEQFSHSMVLLKEAKNVKYGKFVQPGQTLRLTATITKQDEHFTTLRAEGTLEESTSLKAVLVLTRYNLAQNGGDPNTDKSVVIALKKQLQLLYPGYDCE